MWDLPSTKVLPPHRRQGLRHEGRRSRYSERVCAGLRGRVLEIGFGSGLNTPHYPAAVTSVDAIEPSDLAWKLAGTRLVAATIPVTRSGLHGEKLLPDGSRDTAVSAMDPLHDPRRRRRARRRAASPRAGRDAALVVEHGLAPPTSVCGAGSIDLLGDRPGVQSRTSSRGLPAVTARLDSRKGRDSPTARLHRHPSTRPDEDGAPKFLVPTLGAAASVAAVRRTPPRDGPRSRRR